MPALPTLRAIPFPITHRKWHDAIVRVLVADEFALFRRQVVSTLERESDIEVVGEAPDAQVAATDAAHVAPDVVVLGTHLPPRGGVAMGATLRELLPPVALVLAFDVDDERDEQQLLRAVRVGVTGFLPRDAVEAAPEVVRSVSVGRPVLDAQTARLVVDDYERAASAAAGPAPPELNGHERRVLDLIAAGTSLPGTAAQLGVSRATASNAVANALGKLQRFARQQARRTATRQPHR
jgi:DNA-binding NarL/FixJ family response regulator